MENSNISWKRMIFKGNKVWMALNPDGNPLYKNGKVLIKYNVNQEYEYWVNENSLEPVDKTGKPEMKDAGKPVLPENKKKQTQERFKPKQRAHSPLLAAGLASESEIDQKSLRSKIPRPLCGGELQSHDENIPEDAVCIYTDGASSGNPGPSGIGILFRFGKHEKEVARYIGITTNNVAELEAIKTALLELKTTKNPVRIYTDSSYSFGVLSLNWKAKKNVELIESIKKLMARFNDLKLIKVKGHAGREGNERADFLATRATKNIV